jgi:phospholipase/carboxylesterase
VASALESWPHRLRPASGEPEGALILFHGRGTSELDLVPLFDELDPGRRLTGLTPRGPLTLPPGGAHWYAVQRVGYPDPPTFLDVYGRVSSWLGLVAEELAVPWDRVVLGGFSQGAVMSYSLALGPERPTPAGILAMSGFLPTVEGFELELERARGLPVAITHGSLDPVIPVDFGRDARRRLSDAGADVSYRESPVPHTIDPVAIPELREWLEHTVA